MLNTHQNIRFGINLREKGEPLELLGCGGREIDLENKGKELVGIWRLTGTLMHNGGIRKKKRADGRLA